MPFYFTSKPQEPELRFSPPRVPTPGPGEYEPQRSSRASQRRSPAYSIGSRSPPSPPKTVVPGPGQYSPKEVGLRTSPKFSLYARREERPATTTSTPGPGAYRHLTYDPVLPRTPTYSMSSSSPPSRSILADEYEESTPGPGTFNPRDVGRPSAPAFSFAPRLSTSRQPDPTPGPGAYSRATNVNALSGHQRGPAFSFAKPSGKR